MESYISSVERQLLYYRKLAEETISQLTYSQICWRADEEANSIAIIMNHMAGNMRSRFLDFLCSDGEKSWRDRDAEFEPQDVPLSQLLDMWNDAWDCVISTLKKITISDLERIVYIRNEGHTVVEAVNRQVAHYAYHVGQIVFIGRMLKGLSWQCLSIPRGRSTDYNDDKFSRDNGIRHFTDNV